MSAFLPFPSLSGKCQRSCPLRKVIFLLIPIGLSLITCTADALNPSRQITQYVHNVWTTENGLPQNTVLSIVQTQNGYLWVATQDGLARFDGVSFKVFDRRKFPEFKSNQMNVLYEDHRSILWVGTEGGGLSRIEAGKIRTFTKKEGLADDYIRALQEDREGALWIGNRDHGLTRYKDGKFTTFTTQDGLPDNSVRALLADHHGKLWIGTRNGGLARYENGTFSTLATKDGLSNNFVWTLHEDRNENLWIGTVGGGLNRLSKGTISVFSTKDGLSSDSVRAIDEDNQGNLWIGTSEGGLDRFTEGRFAKFGVKEGLSNETVIALLEDREGSLWVGTNGGGLNRLRDGKYCTFTTREGLSNDYVRAIYEDHEHHIWIGTSSGLNLYQDSTFHHFTTKDGLSSDVINSITEDQEGTIWTATSGGGLNSIRNGHFAGSLTERLNNDFIYSIYTDREGGIWVGAEDGLKYLNNGKWTPFQAKGAPGNSDTVWTISQDKEGAIWMGTEGRVFRFKDGGWSHYHVGNERSTDVVNAIYEDHQGGLWIGTYGSGLYRYKDGRFIKIGVEDGLPDDVIYGMVEDANRTLWMAGNKGAFSVSDKDLHDFTDRKIKSVHCTSYGVADGMRTQEGSGGQPTVFQTHNGQIWFATIKGASMIEPAHIHNNTVPPPIHIEEVIIDGKTVPSPSDSTISLQRPVSLSPGKENFEFHYTALSLLIPERVRFRYKLEGLDKDWIDAGIRRVAYYTNIAPGDYTFRVRACNDDGVWNEAGAFFAFRLRPHFYQTTWFRVLCFFSIVMAALGAHKLRVEQLQASERRLVQIVEERTRELRESNEQTQAAHEKLRQAQERIDKLMESAPQAVENLAAWSQSVSNEIARAIQASEIAVWAYEGEQLVALHGENSAPPSMECLIPAGSGFVTNGNETLVAVRGLTGDICGALSVSGCSGKWGDAERRLVAGFAHQLGGALEMNRMRKQLSEAERNTHASREELHEKGVATLQLCPRCHRCYDHTAVRCEDDGASLESPRLLPYRILDRYRLAHLLGEGGMGSVFKAFDEKLNRLVSIKVIRAELVNEPIMRVRLEREAHTMARIQHPGIVSIYDFGQLPDGSAFLTMEFLEGLDLAKVLKRDGPATPSQAAMILTQVGAALSTAHALGIIHRDLKPANLFIVPRTSGIQTKLVDFGLAKSIVGERNVTMSGTLVGSPGYMSPEQIREESLDGRSDLFSLATVTYEILTGTPAFHAEYVHEVLVKILNDSPLPLASIMPGISMEVDRLLCEAWQKAPEDRPPNVMAWIERIVPVLLGTPASVPGWSLSLLQERLTGNGA